MRRRARSASPAPPERRRAQKKPIPLSPLVGHSSFGLRTILIETVVFIVWIVLLTVNAILLVLRPLLRQLDACMGAAPTEAGPRRVVIVGASFAGLAAQRELSGRRDVTVTLVDFKSYFEYTPGILRCFVKPDFLGELTCALPSSRNELILGAMTRADAEGVVIRDVQGAVRTVPYDYLVLAVGSTYADPIKPLESEPTLRARAASWEQAAAKLAAASTVIIVGAGPVGVELAGEILTVFPQKRVTFVDMARTILPGFSESAASYTKAWFAARGAEMRLGEAIDQISSNSLLLKSGELLEADVVYKCVRMMPPHGDPSPFSHAPLLLFAALHPSPFTPLSSSAYLPASASLSPSPRCVGVMPNTAMLKGSSIFASSFGFRDSIEVNDYLQLARHPNVYCVGDMMVHASRELKLGHTAEVNAHLAAHNIIADIHGEPLLAYPHGVTGADTTPKIWCLSLGRYYAVVGFNGLVLCGWYVAVLKWLLEWTKVAAAGEQPVGILFWKVADTTSNWLHRTLLRPRKAHAA